MDTKAIIQRSMIWSLGITMIWHSAACAKQIVEAAPAFPTIAEPGPVYTAEFFVIAIPTGTQETESDSIFIRLLDKIDPASIEIQGSEVADPDHPVVMTENSTGPQPQVIAPMCGTPVFVATVSRTQVNDLMARLKTDQQIDFKQAPKVRTRPGQLATIFDGSYRPIVSSLQRIESADSDGVTYQPQLKWVMDGTLLRTVMNESRDKIQIKINIDCVDILSIKAIEIADAVDADVDDPQSLALQIPEIDAKVLQISKEINSGESLLLIPSWDPVRVRPASVAHPNAIAYVANLLGGTKPKQYDARIAFLVTVTRN